jgi:hypothetical protein
MGQPSPLTILSGVATIVQPLRSVIESKLAIYSTKTTPALRNIL